VSKIQSICCGVVFAFEMFCCAAAFSATPVADVVLRGGKIYLVEPEGKWASALAVREGKILAVGSDAEIQALSGPRTQTIDLKGRMVMPGINDIHVHLGAAAADLKTYTCTFSQYDSLDKILAAVRECAKAKGPNDWIIGQSWSSALYRELGDASAIKRLDEASGGRPVILRNDTIHDRWVNSRALAVAGVTKQTPDPLPGKIGRDPKTGELNGLLLENAGELVTKHVSEISAPRTQEQIVETLAFGVRHLNSVGVTGFDDALVFASGGEWSSLSAYHLLDKRGLLTARAALSMAVRPHADLEKIFADRAAVRSDHLSAGFAKIFLDGVMVSRTAVFLDPYLPDEEHGANFRGMPTMDQATLNALITALDKRDISVKVHVAADGSTRMAIDAIEAARKRNGKGGPIHTLAHAGYIAPTDIPRIRQVNAAIDASPTVWYPGPILQATEAVLGKERANHFWPFKTFIANGVLVAGGTDWKSLPDEFSELWDGIQGMVTRRNPRAAAPGALWPEEAIDIASVIKIYTLNSANAMRIADRTGSLKVGKSADLIVLDRNLFDVPAEQISKTKVLLTMFEGKTVYSDEK
jgi:predicted amidohydrolase YtcJ